MALPHHLDVAALAAIPLDYVWDNVTFNALWATNDDDNPRLAVALQLISTKAAFAVGVACAGWVVARVSANVDISDSLLRLEAAWAAATDWRYAAFTRQSDALLSLAPAPWAQPPYLAMKLVGLAHDFYRAGAGARMRPRAQALAMLAEHVAGRHPAFTPWLAGSLGRCHAHFPRSTPPHASEPPLPPNLFDPAFTYDAAVAGGLVDQYLAGLDPAKNPYLRSPADMVAAGFIGQPYGRP